MINVELSMNNKCDECRTEIKDMQNCYCEECFNDLKNDNESLRFENAKLTDEKIELEKKIEELNLTIKEFDYE